MATSKRTSEETRNFYESLLSDSQGSYSEYRNSLKFFNHHKESDKVHKVKIIMHKLFPTKRRGGNKIKLKGSCNDCKFLKADNREYRLTPNICNNPKSYKHEFYVTRLKEGCNNHEVRT